MTAAVKVNAGAANAAHPQIWGLGQSDTQDKKACPRWTSKPRLNRLLGLHDPRPRVVETSSCKLSPFIIVWRGQRRAKVN